MAKTQLTKELEQSLFDNLNQIGTFLCDEVKIGNFGIVDLLSLDTKGIVRCYEIKVSVNDFRSNALKTFIGHYNYLVLTPQVYQVVKEEIPKEIGCYVGEKGYVQLVKRPRKNSLVVDSELLHYSMIKSLSRENDKYRKYKYQDITRFSDKELYDDLLRREQGKNYFKKIEKAIMDESNLLLTEHLKEQTEEISFLRGEKRRLLKLLQDNEIPSTTI